MPRFIDTRGETTLGIGVCGRCYRKFPLAKLMPDPNSNGLMVCKDDLDVLDPYRLPARSAENITLPFVRPDVPLNTDPLGIVTQDDNGFLVDELSEGYLVP